MGCGESMVKYLLFLFNLIFALGGLTLIGLGVAWHLNVAVIVKAFGSHGDHLPISLIVLGSLVFVVSFFGCCGAVTENECMLFTFSICMGLLMLIKIALITLVFVKKEWVDRAVMEVNQHAVAKGIQTEQNPETARIIFAGICGALGAVELVGMVFGCCLATRVRRNYGGFA